MAEGVLDMGEKFQAFRKKCQSITVRLPLTFVFSGLFVMVIILPFTYFWFQNRMLKDYSRMANAITSLMSQVVDGNLVQTYLEEGIDADEYQALRKQLFEIKENYPDVLYAHVIHFEEEGARVIFNLQNTGKMAIGAPGQVMELLDPYREYVDKLVRGMQVSVVTGKTEDGRMFAYFEPVRDDLGKVQCHVCVAFSMEELYQQDFSYLIGVLFVVGIGVTLVLVLDVNMVRRSVIRPLKQMSDCARSFTYDTESDRFRNVQAMEELNIQTHDEIQELYYEFMSVMKESLYYMTNLSRAKNSIQAQEEKLDQISETAYKDALTRVGNQASFNKLTDTLNRDIAEKKAKFAIVMVDLNNLKYVNDTYGHKYGDSYIKGCCNIICGVYKRSPVFRVGGDEFVVVLRNEDYISRLLRMTQITEAFMASYGQESAQPWEKYSASVGMSEYTDADTNVDQVVKRADAAMYENKQKFKKKYGSYR